MTIKSLTLTVLLGASMSPVFALAQPVQSIGAHQRPVLFHDRSPRLHERGAVAHH